jgi:hypothetical protein
MQQRSVQTKIPVAGLFLVLLVVGRVRGEPRRGAEEEGQEGAAGPVLPPAAPRPALVRHWR